MASLVCSPLDQVVQVWAQAGDIFPDGYFMLQKLEKSSDLMAKLALMQTLPTLIENWKL